MKRPNKAVLYAILMGMVCGLVQVAETALLSDRYLHFVRIATIVAFLVFYGRAFRGKFGYWLILAAVSLVTLVGVGYIFGIQ